MINSLRALPRIFIPGQAMDVPFEVPRPEFLKLHDVLRLRSGAKIGVMPNDGTFWVCELDGSLAVPKEKHRPETEASLFVAIAQALPKGDKLDDVIRMNTELGVSRFVIFPGDRSIVRWEEKKLADKMRRMEALIREAAETSFRMILPSVEYLPNLDAVLKKEPNPIVLSEMEAETRHLSAVSEPSTLVIGPEGGWAPREVIKIQPYAVSLGPRVLRTEHAGAAAASVLLLS